MMKNSSKQQCATKRPSTMRTSANIDRPTCRNAEGFPAVARLGACAAAALVLASCGPRDRSLNPSDFQVNGLIVPAGTVIPAGMRPGPKRNYAGLYAEPGTADVCCWIGMRATLFVRKAAGQRTFVAGFYIPVYPAFASGQDLWISFGNDPARTPVHLHPEQQSIRLALPQRLAASSGILPVHVDARVEFVPERDTPHRFSLRGMFGSSKPSPGDNRRLAAVLLYAFFGR
jgi:hypothetical protein